MNAQFNVIPLRFGDLQDYAMTNIVKEDVLGDVENVFVQVTFTNGQAHETLAFRKSNGIYQMKTYGIAPGIID